MALLHSPISSKSLLPLQIEHLLQQALLEDLGQGDVTTDALFGESQEVQAVIRTRQTGVLSGLAVAQHVFLAVDPLTVFDPMLEDGEAMAAGTILAQVRGDVRGLLKAERTALNFLQHLCGIATETARYVQAIEGTGAKITDTRKTTPGLRLLEKQAVVHGGGLPHRFNLGSAVMLKDNHLEAAGGILPAVQKVKTKISHTTKIEVEVETMAQVAEALEAGVDIILLDNMSFDQVRDALALIGNRAITEVSGGVNLETVRAYAETGVQYISTSKITLGAPVLDIGLDF